MVLLVFPLVAFSADNCGVGDEELCSRSELKKICSDNDLKYEKDVQQIDDAVANGDCNGCCSIFSRLEAKLDNIKADKVVRWMDTGERRYCTNEFKDKLAGTWQAAMRKCHRTGEKLILPNSDELHFYQKRGRLVIGDGKGYSRKQKGWEKICSDNDLKYDRDIQRIDDAVASGDCNECCEKFSRWEAGQRHEETAEDASCPYRGGYMSKSKAAKNCRDRTVKLVNGKRVKIN